MNIVDILLSLTIEIVFKLQITVIGFMDIHYVIKYEL